MTRDEIKVAYETLMHDLPSRASGSYQFGAMCYLLIGTIALHGLQDGRSKVCGSALLMAAVLYELMQFRLYSRGKRKRKLECLNREMSHIPDDDHELLALAQRTNDELGAALPMLYTLIFLGIVLYSVSLFISQLMWVERHL